MSTQANRPPHLPLWVGGIAAILVSGIAIASLAISAQGFDGFAEPIEPAEPAAAPAIATPRARAYRCAECGVIESMRTAADETTGVNAPARVAAGGGIEGKPARNYETTIRLQDGLRRVSTGGNPAKWRHGERVTIIAGAD